MLRTINTFIQYIKTALVVFVINQFRTRKLIKELALVLGNYNRSLDIETQERIEFYTKQSALTNLWFTTLRGFKATADENKLALYVGALTPLADDLIDELNLTAHEILDKVDDVNANSTSNIILLNYLNQKIKNLGNTSLQQALKHAINAQNESAVQLSSQLLETEKLKSITAEKGGTATLLYRHILSNPLKTNEKEAIESLGFAMQLINDMFDIHKDFITGQQTLFTNAKNIKEALNLFDIVVNQTITKFRTLDYKNTEIHKFLNLIAVLFARGGVCATMLHKLNDSTDKWDLAKFKRSNLICDMEKTENIRLSLKFSKAFSQQIDRYLSNP